MRTASGLAGLNPRDVVHIQGIASRIGGRYEDGLRVGGEQGEVVAARLSQGRVNRPHLQGLAHCTRGKSI
jgi:hypothetical protein